MKKRLLLVSTVALAVLVLGACGKKEKEETLISSVEVSQASSQSESSQEVVEFEDSVIKGILKEDVSVDGENISLFLVEVEAVEDPNEVAKGINEEGVVLNAASNQIDGEFSADDFKAGQTVEVRLAGNAIMARSLPPQIPGVSIISIKKL